MIRVFIDGSSGTTGLKINERLKSREDVELINLPEDKKKDPEYRKEAMFKADAVFLCLPDAAAIEAAELAGGSKAVIIDASTAHRVDLEWTYGFPELKGYREKIAKAKLIANPGCHATGFIALTAPLIREGILPEDAVLSCFSLTGYSGGGKSMIKDYESGDRDILLDAPRLYALSQTHKHLKEMKAVAGLKKEPLFNPIVADFYSGMETCVSLYREQVKGTMDDIRNIYKEWYHTRVVHYEAEVPKDGFLSAAVLSSRDDMAVCVYGNEDRINLISLFDNLGKGASGAAVQNMNIALGIEETKGLKLY